MRKNKTLNILKIKVRTDIGFSFGDPKTCNKHGVISKTDFFVWY